MENGHQREKERWALGSLTLNLFLTGIKFIFAIFTGSLALMAEAIHSFSDLVASGISLISVKFANKKTKEFPYGLYKLENIASILISFFLFFAAYEILREAFFSKEKVSIQNVEYAIGVMLLAMVLTFIYSRLELKAAKKLNSPVLEADAHHIWADFLSSVIVIVGLVGTYLGYNIDKYAAVLVSLFIIHSGWEIFTSGIKTLLDVSLDKKEIEQIKSIIKRYSAVKEIKYIRGRVAGSFKFLDIEILLNNSSLREAHEIVDNIAYSIKKEIPNIDTVFIHYEPVRQKGLRVGILTDEGKNIKNFSTGRYLNVFDINDNLEIKEVGSIEISEGEREVGIKAKDKNLDMIVSEYHPLDFKVRWDLAKAGIVVWETEKTNLDEALNEVINSWKEFRKTEIKTDVCIS